jgi:dTDP-glucose 4,6-dehydratase
LLDSTKIREQLGWRDEIGWKDGIAETVRWYADNREWWEPLRDRAPVDEAAWR